MFQALRNVIGPYTSFLLKRSFVRDVLTLQAGSVFTLGLGFVKSIVLARLLGLEGFGLYAVAVSFVGTFKLFTGFGQEQSLITYFAEAFHQKSESGMRAVLRYYVILSLIAAGLILALAIISPFIARALYATNAPLIATMASIGFLSLLVSLPHSLTISLLQIVRRVPVMTVLENLSQVLQLLLAAAFVLADFGPTGILMGFLVSNLLMTVIYSRYFILLRREFSLPGIRESVLSGEPIGQYVMQGAWIAIDKNTVNLFPSALLFLLGIWAPASAVGIAQLAFNTSNIPSTLLFAHAVRMANSTLPAMKDKGLAYLREQCALLVKHTLLFHAMLIFASMVVFPAIIVMFYGWEFSAAIVPMLWILLIRLLQPFNVANTSLLRLFRKIHVATQWNLIRIPIDLAVFVCLLRYVLPDAPLLAFVFAILQHQLGAFAMNGYVYYVLLGMRFRFR